MDRKPSTEKKVPPYSGACPKQPHDKIVWRGMFAAAKDAHRKTLGLVAVKGTRGWFQVQGDPTPYSIELSAEELEMFHL
ncbi:hypothetical protein P9A47_gp26 [Xanthomonas phage Elanor]|uniref:Uncharacterized protein n=1 Tax=Xanthomonas phage Elanor TaxID=2939127 RepID=A0A9E7E182_9CAUD|nr:hypothetical protein P9A47_gp26 [Xanthomonas phage Elanor]URA06994.1 hypothetical protein Elanor_BL40026 [Xanthomonas phage Elanor]